MPRPRKMRFVQDQPMANRFHPNRIVDADVKAVLLPVEGLESIRLSDFEGLDQEASSQKMGVSRQTFGRILRHARSKIAEALVTGKELRIEGGDFEMPCGRMKRRRRGPCGPL